MLTIQQDISLKPFHSFGVEVASKYFTSVTNHEEVTEAVNWAKINAVPYLFIGGGSNILFTDNYKGLIIQNCIKGISIIEKKDNNILIKAMSGEVWSNLVDYTVSNNWGGIENLSLIPGTVGAAPMQNIGAYGVELKEVFQSLEAIHLESGKIQVFNKEDCAFGYRESIFKNQYKNQYFILSITLSLTLNPTLNTSYGAISDALKQMGKETNYGVKEVSEAVKAIRTSKLPNPSDIGNAGSFFKNPIIPQSHFNELLSQYPTMPHYPDANGVKIPAGWLIEQLGWKGKQVGNTGAHKHQALVLVNYGNASGKEIYAFSQEIINSVKEKFGIELSREVNII